MKRGILLHRVKRIDFEGSVYAITLRRWYLLGLMISTGTVVLLGVLPIRPDTAGLITVAVLLSGVGGIVLTTPVLAMTAHCVVEAEKGVPPVGIRVGTSPELAWVAARACGWRPTRLFPLPQGSSEARCWSARSHSRSYRMSSPSPPGT
jgi:hypothetical protein